MKKNRKMPQKMSVAMTHFMHIGSIIVLCCVMMILNIVMRADYQKLERNYGKKERELKKLDDDLQRELSHWEMMKTSECLESALKKHGLSMHYPNASQIIRMRADGRAHAGQLSLAKFEQRVRGLQTANYSASAKRARR